MYVYEISPVGTDTNFYPQHFCRWTGNWSTLTRCHLQLSSILQNLHGPRCTFTPRGGQPMGSGRSKLSTILNVLGTILSTYSVPSRWPHSCCSMRACHPQACTLMCLPFRSKPDTSTSRCLSIIWHLNIQSSALKSKCENTHGTTQWNATFYP
jgi:hypothetical protein